MRYKIYLSREAEKFLSRLGRGEEEKIIKRIEKLGEDPEHFGEFRGNFWVLKIGKTGYRVSYRFSKEEKIVKIGAIERRSSSDYKRRFY